MKILIAIPTCFKKDYGKFSSENPDFSDHQHHDGDNSSQVDALRDTWLKDVAGSPHVDYKLFYGWPSLRLPEKDEVFFVGCPDNYEHLPLKTKLICEYAVEADYDFIFKTDSDCYVYVDRLVSEICKRRMQYGGYLILNRGASGAGYVLDREAARIVARYADPDAQWAEDVMVFKTLASHGVHPMMMGEIKVSPPPHYWYPLDKITPTTIAAHAFTPQAMRQLYKREHP